MTKQHVSPEDKGKVHKPEKPEPTKQKVEGPSSAPTGITGLQQTVGNQAVQRLVAQRSGDGPTQLDDETADQINSQRGGGQALESNVQTQMGERMGQDFSGVKVHTDSESNKLNEQLGAKAFTTGQDIFFKDGAYDPGSSGGQELIAHELTHVVQQGQGRVSQGGGMTVNAPGDSFEQEADAVSKGVTDSGAEAASVQRQEEEEEVQAQEEEEEVQAQEMEEEEEEVQAQEMEDEEEVAD